MVDNYYRWDFVGLSTDEKPTPENSDLVTDGSTYYCSDNSKLFIWYKDQWYEKTVSGGGGGTTYTAGNGLTLTGTEFSVNTSTIATQNDLTTGLSTKQDTLTAGDNITISEDTISATDTTYSDFTGTDGTTDGTQGLVPAPTTTDADKFLKSDGTWATASGGSITPVQTPGTSTTDVMSQNAVTSMVYANPSALTQVQLGSSANTSGTNAVGIGANSTARESNSVAVGWRAEANAIGALALGALAVAPGQGQIALGAASGSNDTTQGVMTIGPGNTNYGYNNSNYRLLTGVYDGQSDHDAATYGQVISYAAINGAGAPTTATEGKYVGQLYYDTTNEAMYFLKTIDTTTTPATYTWEALGGGGSITPVQAPGTSITDVMSQNAVTSMVFADPSTRRNITIGNSSSTSNKGVSVGYNARNYGGVSIGNDASCTTDSVAIGPSVSGGATNVAIGSHSSAQALGAIALGPYSSSSTIGEMNISSTDTNYGYNSSNYRIITGVYDGQSAHDAATVGQITPLTDSTAPTTSTVGRLGQIQIDTSTTTAYMCVAADSGTSTYTWKQITA